MAKVKHKIVTAAGALALLGLLGGCSSGMTGTAEVAPSSAGGGIVDFGSAADLGADALAEMESLDQAASESVIRSAWLQIEAEDPRETSDEIVAIVAKVDGRVSSRSVQTDSMADSNRALSAYLELRVPEDRLDEAVEAIQDVGVVRSESRSDVDVTAQHVDLTARVESLGSSIDRLENLIGEAENVSDLIEIEGALAERQAEFDSLTAQLQSLEDQVQYSTISVDVHIPGVVPADGPQNFWEALLAGLKSIGAAIAGSAVVLGWALPWIVLIGVIVGVVALVVSKRRKRATKPEPPRV